MNETYNVRGDSRSLVVTLYDLHYTFF